MTATLKFLRPPSQLTTLGQRIERRIKKTLRLLRADIRFLIMSYLGRFVVLREFAAWWGSHRLAPATTNSAQPTALQPGDTASQIVQRVQQDGYYCGLHLTPDILERLLEFAHTQPCYANRDPQQPFYIHQRAEFERTLEEPLRLASYLSHHNQNAAFQAIAQDPYLLEVASRYLGHPAIYMRGEMAWAFAGAASLADQVKAAQVYHCDINDYKTLKVFFYLNNVGAQQGPHVYLEATHRHRSLPHQVMGQGIAAVPDDQLVAQYGDDRVCVVTGKAGYGFAGDPYCLHKGTVPTTGTRLLLQVEYGIVPYRVWYF